MKKKLCFLAMILIAFNLVSCGMEEEKQDTLDKIVESGAIDSERVIDPVLEETQRLAFGKALWDIYQRGILPDGRQLDYKGVGTAVANSFALMDIDGDDKEELLLKWTNASMAGSVEFIFGYQDGTIYEELSEFPMLSFYDNGAVEAGWSHNQGLAGEFWPYDVLYYEAESDTYRLVGSVDAWDKQLQEINYEGETFPTAIDVDQDGIVYYIFPADWDGNYTEIPLADGEDYENWRNSYFGEAKEINIPYQALTEENIAKLGYPQPDIEISEPVG